MSQPGTGRVLLSPSHFSLAGISFLLGVLGVLFLTTVSAHGALQSPFLGDLVDRGPGIPAVLRLVMSMVKAGCALCVPGNHDMKLMRKLRGRDVQMTHGLSESVAQLETEPAEFRQEVADFLDGLVSHYVLDQGVLLLVLLY